MGERHTATALSGTNTKVIQMINSAVMQLDHVSTCYHLPILIKGHKQAVEALVHQFVYLSVRRLCGRGEAQLVELERLASCITLWIVQLAYGEVP